MKKNECRKCGHEILLGIDDGEWLFTCCCRSVMKTAETARYATTEAARPMSEEQPCDDFTGTQ